MTDTPHPVYPHLFSPITVAGKQLKNRLVHASMSLRYVTDGSVNDDTITYYKNRARGGVSMSITEPMGTTRWNVATRRIQVFGKANGDGLKRFADEVGAEGCLMLGQLQDSGRGNHEGGRKANSIGASPLPDDLSWTVPHALSTEEVEIMIADFAESAAWLKECGWGGIEISAGHGHIFHQFFSPHSNAREDKFGGDIEGRSRLVCDLMTAIRQLAGSDFIIGVKLPGEDGVPGSIDLEESKNISKQVAANGNADYVTYCWGSHSDTLYWHLPDLHGERAPFVEKIRQIAEPFGDIPVGALGLITDPNEGDRAVEAGHADLVMLGRPLVTDPAWGKKAMEGREAQIRYCVSGNTCWQVIIAGGRLQCDNNPRVGQPDEVDWWPAQVETKRKVVVVGTGVAGMEAAWIAGARGHDVTVFGISGDVGGKTRLHAELPGGENLSSIYDYQQLNAKKANVKFELGITASDSDVLALNPDAVILATGSTMSWPSFLPEEYKDEGFFPDLRETMAMLLERPSPQPGTAVIYDHDHTKMTYASAEWLADKFDRVIIVTPRDRIASDEALVNRQGIYARLMQKKVQLLTCFNPSPESAFEEGQITVRNVFNGEEQVIDDVSLFTYATSRIPNLGMESALRKAGVEVHVIGDAYAPRVVVTATADGNKAGLAV
ncbi:MAG: hypothetical protein RIF37_15545 [Rhodospirillaceae bacterium]